MQPGAPQSDTSPTGELIHEKLLQSRTELLRALEAARAMAEAAPPEYAAPIGLIVASLMRGHDRLDQICRDVEALADSHSAAGRITILVVDDSPDSRDVVEMLLQSAGFNVLTAGNGLEALLLAHRCRPAVIVMDVQMPVLDGIEAARLLKSHPLTSDVRVIAHTAARNSKGFEKFFADVVPKPMDPATLLERVRRLLPQTSVPS